MQKRALLPPKATEIESDYLLFKQPKNIKNMHLYFCTFIVLLSGLHLTIIFVID